MQAPPGETATQRQLRIKLGVVQRRVDGAFSRESRALVTRAVPSPRRTKKELSEYHVEFAQQKAKIDRMRAEGKDEFDIKKQASL